MKLCSWCLLALLGLPAAAEELLIPSVAGRVVGAYGADWATEIRVTNTTSTPKTFRVVDWIGTPGWRAKSWTVAPGQILAISGSEVFGDPEALAGRTAYYGAAVADADAGLLVQTAILAGVYRAGGDGIVLCPSWAGGYLGPQESCNRGAGPIFPATRFQAAGTDVNVPWLSTDLDRRTNVSLINPDATPATVSIRVVGADGTYAVDDSVTLEPHSLIQLDNVFASRWASVRTQNGYENAAARLVVRSTNRLYAMAWVISKDNNTVSVSMPVPGP